MVMLISVFEAFILAIYLAANNSYNTEGSVFRLVLDFLLVFCVLTDVLQHVAVVVMSILSTYLRGTKLDAHHVHEMEAIDSVSLGTIHANTARAPDLNIAPTNEVNKGANEGADRKVNGATRRDLANSLDLIDSLLAKSVQHGKDAVVVNRDGRGTPGIRPRNWKPPKPSTRRRG